MNYELGQGPRISFFSTAFTRGRHTSVHLSGAIVHETANTLLSISLCKQQIQADRRNEKHTRPTVVSFSHVNT